MGRNRRSSLLWPLLLAVSTGHLLFTSCGNEDAGGERTREPVPWHLDPDLPALSAEDQDLHVVVSSGCGARSADFLKEPKVEYGEAVVVVRFKVDRPRGPQRLCRTLAKRTVRLRQPIGTTKIVDGTTHQERYPTGAQPLP